MSKELSEETKYELKLFGRELNKDLTNLMELLRKQDEDLRSDDFTLLEGRLAYMRGRDFIAINLFI